MHAFDGTSFKILAPIFLFISLKPLISLGFTFIQQALFNTVDVTTFDLRLSTLFWVFLAALCGVIFQHNSLIKRQ